MDLHLHIGYFKTGSSALQNFFALNCDFLAENKYFYSCNHSWRREASQGKLFQGNGGELCRAIQHKKDDHDNSKIGKVLTGYASRAVAQGADNILLSSENFFPLLVNQSNFASLLRAARGAEIDHISILLFVRDPFDHAKSWYGERIKWGFTDLPMSGWAKSYDFPRKISSLLQSVEENSDLCSIRVRNYSFCKERLLESALEWLRVSLPAIGEKVKRPSMSVNRSLSEFELEVCRLLKANNLNPRAFSSILSSTPVKSVDNRSRMSADFIHHIRINSEPYLKRINQVLPLDEVMQLTDPISCTDEETDTSWTVSLEEITVVARSLSLMLKQQCSTTVDYPNS